MKRGLLVLLAFFTANARAQGPQFFVIQGPLVPPKISNPDGGTSLAQVTVLPANGFTGSVALSCSVSGEGVPAPVCAVTPAAVTLPAAGNAAVTASLSVTGGKSTKTGTYSVTVSGTSRAGSPAFEPVPFPIEIEHRYGVGCDAGGGTFAVAIFASMAAIWTLWRLRNPQPA